MEHSTNNLPVAATNEPASPDAPTTPMSRLSERLGPEIGRAVDAAGEARAGRAIRSDGWTPERIRIFLTTLAECGSATSAASAADISVTSAYRYRNRSEGRAFHLAWNAALGLAQRRLEDVALSRALHGCVDIIVRNGKVWGERHRYDNRLLMAMIE